jgi:hypothetical protein
MSQDAASNYAGVWDSRIGFGQKSALLLIDFMKGYTTGGNVQSHRAAGCSVIDEHQKRRPSSIDEQQHDTLTNFRSSVFLCKLT